MLSNGIDQLRNSPALSGLSRPLTAKTAGPIPAVTPRRRSETGDSVSRRW